MEAGPVGMPNGIHGSYADGGAGVDGQLNLADVSMSEPSATAAENAKAAAIPANGHMAGNPDNTFQRLPSCGTQRCITR